VVVVVVARISRDLRPTQCTGVLVVSHRNYRLSVLGDASVLATDPSLALPHRSMLARSAPTASAWLPLASELASELVSSSVLIEIPLSCSHSSLYTLLRYLVGRHVHRRGEGGGGG
jgi:hypothetical protein